MKPTLEERIAAYLDGDLDERGAAEVEAALSDPAARQLLGEELMVRELLGGMPPSAAPQALIARLEASLGVGVGVTEAVRRRLRGTARAARDARLGSKALAAARLGVNGARVAAAGASGVYSLGLAANLPLPRLSPPPPPKPKPKPAWRRAASFLWRRGRRK